MNGAYLAAVKPSAILRTWSSNIVQAAVGSHDLELSVEFTTPAGLDASLTQTFTTSFSNQLPPGLFKTRGFSNFFVMRPFSKYFQISATLECYNLQ
jgi:hypothetical protein